MFRMPRSHFGVLITSPENIGPPRPPDGPSGILIHNKTGKISPACNFTLTINGGFLTGNKTERPFRKNVAVQGNGSPGSPTP